MQGQRSTMDLTRKRNTLVPQKLPSQERTACHSVPLHVIRYPRFEQPDFLLRIGTTKNQVTHVDANFTTAAPTDASARIGNLFLPPSVKLDLPIPWQQCHFYHFLERGRMYHLYIHQDPHHQGGMNNPKCWTKRPHASTYVDTSCTQKHSLDFVLYSLLQIKSIR